MGDNSRRWRSQADAGGCSSHTVNKQPPMSAATFTETFALVLLRTFRWKVRCFFLNQAAGSLWQDLWMQGCDSVPELSRCVKWIRSDHGRHLWLLCACVCVCTHADSVGCFHKAWIVCLHWCQVAAIQSWIIRAGVSDILISFFFFF